MYKYIPGYLKHILSCIVYLLLSHQGILGLCMYRHIIAGCRLCIVTGYFLCSWQDKEQSWGIKGWDAGLLPVAVLCNEITRS